MIDYLLSIDPSVRATGCALWKDGQLVDVAIIRTQATQPTLAPATWRYITHQMHLWVGVRAPSLMASERPVHHKGSGRKSDPETLLALAMLVGALATSYPCHTQLKTKAQWAGTAPKEIVCQRVLARLTPAEAQTLHDTYNGPPHLLHNVLDAVGVGLHALGRMRK